MKLSVGEIKQLTLHSQESAKRLRPQIQKRESGRYVKWEPGGRYELKRSGRVWSSMDEISTAYAANKISEEMLCLFQNTDRRCERDPCIPVYEAVYELKDQHYVLVQKCHLKQAYSNSERTRRERGWDVLADGTPYWVDRWAFCREGQHASKIRYLEANK